MIPSNTKFLYVENIKIPIELEKKINMELKDYGLPDMEAFVCFKRKMFFEKTSIVHIDYSVQYETINSAIIIPIEGCSDTSMYWMDGNFSTEKKTISGSGYLGIIWLSMPTLIDSVEISSEPCLVRVDVPHGVTSRLDGSYRTIISMRLKNNPTVDEILKLVSESKIRAANGTP